MKARVLSTGRIVEVSQQEGDRNYFVDVDKNPYRIDELDLNVESQDNGEEREFSFPFANILDFSKMDEQSATKEKDAFYRNLAGELLTLHFQSSMRFDSETCAQIVCMVNQFKKMIG